MIVLGESINSTRKSVQKALAEKDGATIRRLAREQVEAGADILDVNTATMLDCLIASRTNAVTDYLFHP